MRTFLKLFLVSFFLIVSSQVFASNDFGDNATSMHPMWGNLGLGIQSNRDSSYVDTKGTRKSYDNAGIAGELSFNLVTLPNQLLTASYLSGGSFFGDKYDSFNLLYGLIHKEQNGYVSASVGVGHSSIDVDDLFGVKLGRNRGIVTASAELQAFWTPTQYFGFGVIVPGMIGSHFSNVGALLAIQIGRLH